jgi:hypothetical protein
MPGEPGLYRIAAERVHLPPMAFDETFHWDGVGPMSRDEAPMTRSKPTLPSMHAARSLTQPSFETQRQTTAGRHARPSVTSSDLCLDPSPPYAIDWAREAACLTVSLDQGLLLATARDAIPGVTGELV